THSSLNHELKRIVTRSPKLTPATLEELEAALIAGDFGMPVTAQILSAVKRGYETQGGDGLDIFGIARREVEQALTRANALHKNRGGLTVVTIVGVNGTGKTTTTAKLAHLLKLQGETVVIAACDTFRAAAIEQLNIWGQRLGIEIVAGDYGA